MNRKRQESWGNNHSLLLTVLSRVGFKIAQELCKINKLFPVYWNPFSYYTGMRDLCREEGLQIRFARGWGWRLSLKFQILLSPMVECTQTNNMHQSLPDGTCPLQNICVDEVCLVLRARFTGHKTLISVLLFLWRLYNFLHS